MLAELDRTGESQISLTDPDSRAMAAHTPCCGRLQRAGRRRREAQADRRVAGHQPSCGYGAAGPDRRTGKRGPWGGADCGRGRPGLYLKIEDIEACGKAGIDAYVPRPQRGPSVRAGLFRKDEFGYDPTATASSARPVNIFIPIRLL
jgi:hypothetical protein